MYKHLYNDLRKCNGYFENCPFYNADFECCETDSTIGICYSKFPELIATAGKNFSILYDV